MARRFVTWWPAAFVGGLAYGFSPFTAATANAHLFLLFQAIPPLVIYFVDRFLRSSTPRPLWSGVAIGLCFVAQFYISSEAFASLAVMTGCAVVLGGGYVLWKHVPFDRRRLLAMVGCAAVVIALGVGYAAWLAVAGPEHITGPAQPATAIAGEAIDPVGLVVPTIDQRYTFGHAGLGDSLVAQRDPDWNIVVESPLENGSYVGVPLLLALVIGGIVLRRNRFALFCSVMGALGLVMSMGSELHVDGHRTGIPLPFIVIAHLPLLDSSVASRWITYSGSSPRCSSPWSWTRCTRWPPRAASGSGVRSSGAGSSRSSSSSRSCRRGPTRPPRQPCPPGSPLARRSLPAGSAALVYPLASPSNDSSMLWQAMADMRFRMPGGFAVIPGPDGANTFVGQASPLADALGQCEGGAASVPDFSAAEVRAQLREWQTETVAVVPTEPGAACATSLFTSALGPPQHQGGVLVWPKVTSKV